MIYKSGEQIDAIYLTNNRNNQVNLDLVVEYTKQRIAHRLGEEISKHIEIEKTEEGFDQHADPVNFVKYEIEVFAVSREDWINFRKELGRILTIQRAELMLLK